MGAYSVDTAAVRRFAVRIEPIAQVLRAAATQVEGAASAASATGSGAAAAHFTAYCHQYAEELRQEALAYERMCTAMAASAALYEATEAANTVLDDLF